ASPTQRRRLRPALAVSRARLAEAPNRRTVFAGCGGGHLPTAHAGRVGFEAHVVDAGGFEAKVRPALFDYRRSLGLRHAVAARPCDTADDERERDAEPNQKSAHPRILEPPARGLPGVFSGRRSKPARPAPVLSFVPLASCRPAEVDPARQLGPDRLRGRPLVTLRKLRVPGFLGQIQECRRGGIGRRTWFRSTRSQGRGGSSPSVGTIVGSSAPAPQAGPHPRFWGPDPKTRRERRSRPAEVNSAGPHPRFWGRCHWELRSCSAEVNSAGPHPRFWGRCHWELR